MTAYSMLDEYRIPLNNAQYGSMADGSNWWVSCISMNANKAASALYPASGWNAIGDVDPSPLYIGAWDQ